MAAAKGNTTNWFAVWISIAVVVVLVGLGGLVVFLNNKATEPGAAPDSDIVNEETGAISFGAGDDVIDTYVDFMCPACNAFEGQFGQQLQSAAANDEITLNIHPISILDRLSQNTKYSTRAANAAYCVAEEAPEGFLDFFNALYANQPAENSTGLTDDELAAFAEQAGAPGAADCIADGTYSDFVEDRTPQTPPGPQGISTPTLTINETRIDNTQFAAELAKILG